MNDHDVELSIRADGYSSQQLHDLSIIGAKEQELISRLRSSSPLLLEGIRGSGKTTLLKLAAEATNKESGSHNGIAVYVSFSRYLLLENPHIPIGPSHPFIVWVCTKLLIATYQTALEVTGRTPGHLPNLAPFLESSFEAIITSLESTHKLGSSDGLPTGQLPNSTQRALSELHNPDKLKSLLIEIMDAFGLRSLNFLCDEAAQYFKAEFQPLFFLLLKSIHIPSISFKAAVYPTITYFGADFELGHDASVVQITRPCLSDEWVTFCRAITERRFHAMSLWNERPVLMEALALSGFGIPRRFIELLGSLDISSATELDVLNAIKSHAQRELLQPFEALKARIPALVREVELASYLLHLFIADLKQENTTRAYRTAYIAISKHRALPYALRKSINLLVYLGILERQPSTKLGHSRDTADRLLLNPALVISENLLADASKRRLSLREANERLKQLELEKFREYSRNSKSLLEAVEEVRVTDTKPCPQCGMDLPVEARFCTNCGTPQNQQSILFQFLSLPSSELDLTPGIKARVTARFATVREVFDADDPELDAIPFIGPTRIAFIRHAVDELISG